jgi:hypothetical protein
MDSETRRTSSLWAWAHWPVPFWTRLVVLALFAGGALLWVLWLTVGQGAQEREREIGVMRREIAALPPPAGSDAEDRTERYLLPYPVDTTIVYAKQGTCADILAYYAEQARRQGWRHTGHTAHDEYDDEYHKEVGGYALDLSVSCSDRNDIDSYVISMTG